MQQGPMIISSRPPDREVLVRRSGLIATLPRSGSWLLAEALQQTGLVGQSAEFFRPDYRYLFAQEWGLSKGHDVRAYVGAALARTSSDTGVFTGKLHWYQMGWLARELGRLEDAKGKSWAQNIAAVFPRPTYIYLYRRDKIRQAISYYRASKTQQWFDKGPNGSSPRDHQDPELDLQQIRYFEDVLVSHEAQWERFFESNSITPLRISYEDLTSSYAFTIVRVLDALGLDLRVEDVAAAPVLRRQSDRKTEGWLEQYWAARDSLEPLGPQVTWSEELRSYVRTGSQHPVDAKSSAPPNGQAPGADHGASSPSAPASPQPPTLSESPHLSDPWRRWVATMKLRGQPDDRILAILTEHGSDPAAARREIELASSHPYLRAAHDMVQQLLKLESVCEVSRTVAKTSASPLAIDRRTALSASDFVEEYYSRSQPVILDGIADEWPARSWTPEVLRDRCGDIEIEIMEGREDDPQYEIRCAAHRGKISMARYIDQILGYDSSNDVYLVANNHFFEGDMGKELLAELAPLPAFLKPDTTGQQTFLWLGPKGTITPLHHDVVNVLFVQLYGSKQFLMLPPDHTPIVYNWKGVFSAVDPQNPDPGLHPLFKNADLRTVELRAGEALFIPVGWWHHVTSLEASISTSFTYFCAPNTFKYHSPNPA